jgi:hypothetical protein
LAAELADHFPSGAYHAGLDAEHHDILQSFQQLPARMVLQTPIGSLPLQQLADRARDLGTGEKPERRSVHRKFSTNIRSLPGT